jgi:hypothetical protein
VLQHQRGPLAWVSAGTLVADRAAVLLAGGCCYLSSSSLLLLLSACHYAAAAAPMPGCSAVSVFFLLVGTPAAAGQVAAVWPASTDS